MHRRTNAQVTAGNDRGRKAIQNQIKRQRVKNQTKGPIINVNSSQREVCVEIDVVRPKLQPKRKFSKNIKSNAKDKTWYLINLPVTT